jgi:hypothetical protein
MVPTAQDVARQFQLTFGYTRLQMVTMVTMGLQPGCLADRLLTGLGQPQINP